MSSVPIDRPATPVLDDKSCSQNSNPLPEFMDEEYPEGSLALHVVEINRDGTNTIKVRFSDAVSMRRMIFDVDLERLLKEADVLIKVNTMIKEREKRAADEGQEDSSDVKKCKFSATVQDEKSE